MTRVKMRTGRLSIEDMDFIEKNWKTMSYTDIARSLDRTMTSVKNYVETKLKNNDGLSTKALRVDFDITSRPYWPEIEQQFEKHELPLFIYHWENTISQFKDDVLPTEEMQIVDMVTKTMLMNRILKEQKIIKNNIIKLETALLEENNKDVAIRDMQLINSMGMQLSMMRQAEQSSSKGYQELSTHKNSLLEKLKATRNQRFKDMENVRQSFTGFMTVLLQDKNLRREWGIYIEKMRIAAEQERLRLSEYHTYQDGVIDQPLLTPENIKEDNVLH